MKLRKKRAQSDQVYRLKVTLKGAKPPIWRRIDVSGDVTLYDLHLTIQATMGWDNAHLHQFIIGGEFYGLPDEDMDLEVEDETRMILDQFGFREKSKFFYEYDFGDDWQHEIVVEKVLPRKPGEPYPVCLKGKRACPPEDVGGVWGYADFLEVIRDPEHPEYEETLDWVGEGFDPEYFDLDEINARLRRMQ
jgi:hypothetical protein